MENELILPKQGMDAAFPTRHEHLAELIKRGALGQVHLDEYNRLERGFQGEQLVIEYIREYGNENWTVLRNVWLNYYGEYEIDILILASHALHTLEVKNLSGDHVFKNNQCWRNGEQMGRNAIAQAQKSIANTTNLFKNAHFKQPVIGALVFTGDHFSLDVQDNVGDLDILVKTDLRKYIWDIVAAERQYQYHGLNINKAMRTLSKFEAHNLYPAYSLTPEMESKIRKGIMCSHCGAFDIYARDTYLTCDCGMTEPRENAIVRTICEYGVIHYEKELTTGELYDFFGGEVYRGTLSSYLNTYFEKSGTGKGTFYKNLRKPYRVLRPKFNFKRSRYYKC